MFPNTWSRQLNVYNEYLQCVHFIMAVSEVRHNRTGTPSHGMNGRLPGSHSPAKATPFLAGDLASRLSAYVEMESR